MRVRRHGLLLLLLLVIVVLEGKLVLGRRFSHDQSFALQLYHLLFAPRLKEAGVNTTSERAWQGMN